jgi:tellurite resistance protein
MVLTRDFYAGLGCLAYAMAAADGNVEKAELDSMGRSFLSSFSEWDIKSSGLKAFALFDMHVDLNSTSDQAYAEALKYFKIVSNEVKAHSTDIVRVLQKISASDRVAEAEELQLIRRFQQDVETL